ncbi:hypothetical protein HNO89_004193 [Sporosarcina luteola]|nr:hypothetical protein [Sporosarcina luteola]
MYGRFASIYERFSRFTSGCRIIRAVLTIYERSRDYMSGSHDLRAVAGLYERFS